MSPMSPRLLRPRARGGDFDLRTLGTMNVWLTAKSANISGTTWADSSGNSRNGTLINGPTAGTDNGGSLTFDGVNDYVSISAGSSTWATLIAAPWTISLWFRSTGAQSTRGIFGIDSLPFTGGVSLLLQRENSTTVRWYMNNGYRISHSVSDNVFAHFALTYDGTIYRAYLNGSADGTYTGGFAGLTDGAAIGVGFNGYSSGRATEFGMWPSVLSASDISTLYTRTQARHA